MTMNERPKIPYPRITMIGQRINGFGNARSAIEVLMDIPMAIHADELIDGIKLACNETRNAIEEETGQSFYYGVQRKDDIWHGHPGLAIYIDFANNDDLPLEAVHGRERRVLPRFAEAIEPVLAQFREKTEPPIEVAPLWTDLGK